MTITSAQKHSDIIIWWLNNLDDEFSALRKAQAGGLTLQIRSKKYSPLLIETLQDEKEAMRANLFYSHDLEVPYYLTFTGSGTHITKKPRNNLQHTTWKQTRGYKEIFTWSDISGETKYFSPKNSYRIKLKD